MVKHIYVGPERRWYEDIPRPILGLAAGCILLLIVIGVGIFSCSSAQSQPPAEVEPVADVSDVIAQEPQLNYSPEIVDAASDTTDISLFSAFSGTSEALSAETAAPIEAAIAAFSEQGYGTGFVVVDLSTGKGIGYNSDEAFFAASTVKAPFVSYVSQVLIDEGQATEEDYLYEDTIIEGTGIMAWDDVESYELSDVLANTISHSDNTGYGMLRETYGGPRWAEWVANAGVSTDDVVDEWYPYYSARDLAKFWVSIKSYLDSGSATATQFKTHLSSTDTSFIRMAVAPNSTVYAKAGYEVDTDTFDMGSLNEAGIVSSASGDYLIAVMSDVDYDDGYLTDNEYLLVNLIKALDQAHAAALVA